MARTPKILVVEDEADIRELMLLHIGRAGYESTWAANGENALKILESGEAFDLAILDWMLPGVSGLDVCKQINRRIPVLMVTARAEAADIVWGLESGADDYVTKPFEIPVFLARIRALLRRAARTPAEKSRNHRVGELSVDIETHTVRCGKDDVKLTPSEFKLLWALMENQGKVLSRDKLIDLVQGEGVVVVDRAIDTHVFGLRKRLGACAEVIETIRGVGYRVKTDL